MILILEMTFVAHFSLLCDFDSAGSHLKKEVRARRLGATQAYYPQGKGETKSRLCQFLELVVIRHRLMNSASVTSFSQSRRSSLCQLIRS